MDFLSLLIRVSYYFPLNLSIELPAIPSASRTRRRLILIGRVGKTSPLSSHAQHSPMAIEHAAPSPID
jgi:hypothetical protein